MATQRVLIVEPDQQTATWLSRALGTAGFEVSLAFDAATGHAIATSLPPDLAVIDLEREVLLPRIELRWVGALASWGRDKGAHEGWIGRLELWLLWSPVPAW